MSDDTFETYGRGPIKPRQGFGSLRTTWILLSCLVVLFGAQQAISNWLIFTQPGQIVLCVGEEMVEIEPIRTPGPHWCRGEVVTFFEQRRVGGDISFRFRDGVPGSVNVDMLYSLPHDNENDWDPAVMIYLTYGSQQKFEETALQSATLLGVIRSFSLISSRAFLMAPNEAAPLISQSVELHIRGRLMARDNIHIRIDSILMKGKSRIPIPSRPGLTLKHEKKVAI